MWVSENARGSFRKYVNDTPKVLHYAEIEKKVSSVSIRNAMIVLGIDLVVLMIGISMCFSPLFNDPDTIYWQYISLILIFLALVVIPVIIGLMRNSGGGRFTLWEMATKAYYLQLCSNGILLWDIDIENLPEPADEFIASTTPKLVKVLQYKRYNRGITKTFCEVFYPTTNKTKRQRIWIANDEPLYDKIINNKWSAL